MAAFSLTHFFSLVALSLPVFIYYGLPFIFKALGRLGGLYLRQKSAARRVQILTSMEQDGSEHMSNLDHMIVQCRSKDWDGVIGFLHPFCNAGGGGERVLWAAIKATQQAWPRAKCVVYTGNHEANKHEILDRVEAQFNIYLHRPTICFLYLTTRDWIMPEQWPHFTLLGQSIGSIIMLLDALHMMVPDVMFDTMGYAFALGACKLLFPSIPTCAYVHYPTISSDMIESLNPDSPNGTHGRNAGQGVGLRGLAKRTYWKLFATMYTFVGSTIDIVMTNSSWTQAHIQKLWGPRRHRRKGMRPITVVYPPVSVKMMQQGIGLTETSETRRSRAILYIAQFRPEKDHQLIIESFARFLKSDSEATKDAELVLVGSVRDASDAKRIYHLRLLVNELHVKDRVKFILDATWDQILEQLARCSIGANGMWNEHFGIGVVEYQAAGLIAVVHNSGGPKMDIVVDQPDGPTGYHAETVDEFAQAYAKVFSLTSVELVAMRQRARRSSARFTEEAFCQRWIEETEALIGMISKR